VNRLGLLRYIVKRLLLFIPILFGITLITFTISYFLPGDPAAVRLGGSPSVEALEEMRIKMGLYKPIWERYLIYMTDLLKGDLGRSYLTDRPVLYEISDRILATLELSFVSLFIIVVVGIPLGILSAFKKNSIIDHVARFVGVSGISIPSFWLGLVLIFLLFYVARIFPPPLGRLPPGVDEPARITGFYIVDSLLSGNWETLKLSIYYISLPAITTALVNLAPITRMTRSAVLDVLEKDYIKAARAAGLPERQIYKDALKNASIPILTTIGLSIGFMISGSIVIEKVFSWPGIGLFALQSIASNDHNPIQAYILIVGLTFALINLLTDIAYGFVDPRIKYG